MFENPKMTPNNRVSLLALRRSTKKKFEKNFLDLENVSTSKIFFRGRNFSEVKKILGQFFFLLIRLELFGTDFKFKKKKSDFFFVAHFFSKSPKWTFWAKS